MTKKTIEGFITSSDPVSKYGGVAVGLSSLRNVAEDIKQTEFMTIEHDGRDRVSVRVLDAEVRPTERGTLGVWISGELDEEDWLRLGGRLNISISLIEPLLPADPASIKPGIFLAPEAGQFDEDTIEAAAAALRPFANVSTGRLFRFSEQVDLAKIVAELLIVTLQSVGANAIYDALKLFLSGSKGDKAARPTVFEFKLREEKGKDKHLRVVSAYVETNDPEVLRQALTILESAVGGSGDLLDFDEEQSAWKELR